MASFMCVACGTQYSESPLPPSSCSICTDERQFVPSGGQSWTTLGDMQRTHSNKFRRLAPNILTIETTPHFGIGQRAFLVSTPEGMGVPIYLHSADRQW